MAKLSQRTGLANQIHDAGRSCRRKHRDEDVSRLLQLSQFVAAYGAIDMARKSDSRRWGSSAARRQPGCYMGNGARCYVCVRAKCKYKRASHGCAAVTGSAEKPTAIQPNVEAVCFNNQRTQLRYQVKTRLGPRCSPWWVDHTVGRRGCMAISCDHMAWGWVMILAQVVQV